MTDIEAKALALLNEVWEGRGYPPEDKVRREDLPAHEALCRAIEQHEAAKRERDNLATALKETAAACADHVNTILQLRSELADFKQKVSDAATETVTFLEWCGCGPDHDARKRIAPFIIPKPKPDPLVEVIEKCAAQLHLTSEDAANALRAALDDFGFEIREKGQ